MKYITIFRLFWPNTSQKDEFVRREWMDVFPTKSDVKELLYNLKTERKQDIEKGAKLEMFIHYKQEFAPEPDFTMPSIM